MGLETGNVLPRGARRLAVPLEAVPAPRAEDYERLLQISLQLNSSPRLDDLLARILESARELLGAEDASLMLLDRDGRTLTFGAIDSPYSESLRGITLEIGEGVAGWVALHGEPLIVEDTYADPRFSVKGDLASGHRTSNMLCVPMKTPHRTIGTLEVINMRDSCNPHDLPLCMSLANMAAIAIENIQLRQAAEDGLARIEEIQRSRVEFLHVLSHELRTPLAVVAMGLSVLKGRTDGSELAAETLRSMVVNSSRLKRLIQDLFIINDIESLSNRLLLRPLRVREITALVEHFQPGEGDGTLELDIEPACAELRVRADREKVAHCLTHLLDNAFKFSHGDARVTLEARREAATPMVRLSVKDHGVGIPPEHQGRIFDMFYQVDSSATREYGGTGIGLYVTRHIIAAHGGQVWCRSVPGEGSTFSFTLPIAEAAAGGKM